MSEERLKEIKDSIDFQVDYMKSINFDNVIVNEEKELYEEVIRLKEDLEVTQDNEETYRLEMQEITKILGLDEHTIFDEVKEYARNLVKDNEMYSQLKDTNEEELRQEIDENYKLSELWLQSQNEVKRLNNIINELEKYCNEVIEETKSFTNTWDRAERKAIEQLQIRNRQNESALTNKEETIISKHELLKREIIENDFLIGLLKGSDKE